MPNSEKIAILENRVNAICDCILSDSLSEQKAARNNLRMILGLKKESSCVKKDAEFIIRDTLLNLGAPEHLTGHEYAVYSIILAHENKDYIHNITYGLYPQVATHFGTTSGKVERAIRHLIEVIFNRGDPDILMQYFGNTVSPTKGKPTNGEFIARISNVVRMQLKNT